MSATFQPTRYLRLLMPVLWLSLVATSLLTMLTHPEWFDASRIVARLQRYEGYMLAVYLGLALIRGVVLLPITPVVIAGGMLFPQHLWLVYLISVGSTVLSTWLLYHFANWLRFDAYFERRYPHTVSYVQEKLHHPRSFWYMLACAAFPLAPTDLVSCVAGSLRLRFDRLLLANTLGQAMLFLGYLYLGGYAVNWFLG